MRHLDLFSGIGGFALAARWMGWETVAFCEIEDYPRRVLAKNFPGVPIHDDIHTLDGNAYRGRVQLVTGGFPCQPHSTAGLRRGRDDARHLWPQFARIIAEARPAWVVVENVPGIRTTAADEVLADLESLDYACWPIVVGAVHAGAPHRRQRVWIVANADKQRSEHAVDDTGNPGQTEWDLSGRRCDEDAANTESERWRGRVEPPQIVGYSDKNARLSDDEIGCVSEREDAKSAGICYGTAADASQHGRREGRAESARIEGRHGAADGCSDAYQPDWRGWTDAPQPAVRAVDDGLPAWVAGCRVPALKALGNAIVPQVAFEVFRAIEAAVLESAEFVRTPTAIQADQDAADCVASRNPGVSWTKTE